MIDFVGLGNKAQELAGASGINAAQLRDGFEALEITEERMAELGLPNFGQPFKASCEEHGGLGAALIQQWDATAKKWSLITGFIAPDDEVLVPLVMEDSAAFAAENSIAERCN